MHPKGDMIEGINNMRHVIFSKDGLDEKEDLSLARARIYAVN